MDVSQRVLEVGFVTPGHELHRQWLSQMVRYVLLSQSATLLESSKITLTYEHRSVFLNRGVGSDFWAQLSEIYGSKDSWRPFKSALLRHLIRFEASKRNHGN